MPQLGEVIMIMGIVGALIASFKIGQLRGWEEGMKDCSWAWGTTVDRTMAEARRQKRWPETRAALIQRQEFIEGRAAPWTQKNG